MSREYLPFASDHVHKPMAAAVHKWRPNFGMTSPLLPQDFPILTHEFHDSSRNGEDLCKRREDITDDWIAVDPCQLDQSGRRLPAAG
jgi:hypothetical protein